MFTKLLFLDLVTLKPFQKDPFTGSLIQLPLVDPCTSQLPSLGVRLSGNTHFGTLTSTRRVVTTLLVILNPSLTDSHSSSTSVLFQYTLVPNLPV